VDPADPLAGFAPPTGWTARAEPDIGPAEGVATILTYVDPARPDEAALSVRATSPGRVASSYLLTAMAGHESDGGIAVARQDRPRTGASPFTHAVWPDGRQVAVWGHERLADATAEQIALGVRPSSGEEIARMGAELSQRLGVGDVLAAADLPAGRVELVGSANPSAVCLVVDGTRTCRAALGSDGRAPVAVIGSAAIGPTWFLFGASREGIQITDDETSDALFPVFEDGEPVDPDMPLKISAPMAGDGGWYLSVLAVRPDAQQAYVAGIGMVTKGRTLI
jgi:hypothetical protein